MNTKKSVLIILPILAVILMACGVSLGSVGINRSVVQGSGTTATEERDVRDVERVYLTDMGSLEIIQGDEEGLTIEADDNVLRYIETEMRGRELEIGVQNGVRVEPKTSIRYILRVKSLNQVNISGSGNVTAEKLEAGDLDLRISGSGNIQIGQLAAEDLKVNTSGSGNFTLDGVVTSQDITISGSGNYVAADLESDQVEINITGSGDLTVWANEKLDIRISGQGTVNYYGTPAVSQSITGSGKIKSLGEHK